MLHSGVTSVKYLLFKVVEVIYQQIKECEGFIRVPKHRETDETAECFYCFEVFEAPDETRSTSF